MTVTLAEIREALGDTLEETGVNVRRYPPGSINPPCLFPGLRTGRNVTQDGGSRITAKWWFAVSATVDDQRDGIDYMIDGDQSLPAVLDATPDLGLGDTVSCTVTGDWKEAQVEVGGTVYWGVEFTLEIEF